MTDLIDLRECCRLLGGNRPLNPSTLYRYVAKGLWPRPAKVGGNSRWIKSECDEALAKMIAARKGGGSNGGDLSRSNASRTAGDVD